MGGFRYTNTHDPTDHHSQTHTTSLSVEANNWNINTMIPNISIVCYQCVCLFVIDLIKHSLFTLVQRLLATKTIYHQCFDSFRTFIHMRTILNS